jgi:hypothetical protein
VAVLLLAAALTTACTRAMQVASEPAPVYRLTIVNEFAEAMVVSYNDGRGDRILGAVPPGRSDTFVVAGSASSTIVLSARNGAGTLTWGPATTTLALGDSVTQHIRP